MSVGKYRKNRKLTGNVTFTVGDVAELCDVSCRTVTLWFDSGKLGGWRISTSDKPTGDRRIPWRCLVEFLRTNRMTYVLRSLSPVLLSVNCPPAVVTILQTTCQLRGYELEICTGLLAAGRVVGERVLVGAVVDTSLGTPEVMSLLYSIPSLPCILVLPEGADESVWKGTTSVRSPIDPKKLIETVSAIL